MHLPLVPCVCGLAALLAAPAAAQHTLTARTFEPSLPAIAPAPEPPVLEWWRVGGPLSMVYLLVIVLVINLLY